MNTITASIGDTVYVLCHDKITGEPILDGEYEVCDVWPYHSCGPCIQIVETPTTKSCVLWSQCLPLAFRGQRVS